MMFFSVQKENFKNTFLSLAGYEPRILGVWSDHSTNCATAFAQIVNKVMIRHSRVLKESVAATSSKEPTSSECGLGLGLLFILQHVHQWQWKEKLSCSADHRLSFLSSTLLSHLCFLHHFISFTLTHFFSLSLSFLLACSLSLLLFLVLSFSLSLSLSLFP